MADQVKEKLQVKKRNRKRAVSMSLEKIPHEVHEKVVSNGRKFLSAKCPGGSFSVKEAYMAFLIEHTKDQSEL
jgi:hypothetical protein